MRSLERGFAWLWLSAQFWMPQILYGLHSGYSWLFTIMTICFLGKWVSWQGTPAAKENRDTPNKSDSSKCAYR